MDITLTAHASLSISLRSYTTAQFLAIAEKTMVSLGWEVEWIETTQLIAFTPEAPDASYEKVTLTVKGNTALLRSQSIPWQWLDGGQNRHNLHHFRMEFNEVAFSIREEEIHQRIHAQRARQLQYQELTVEEGMAADIQEPESWLSVWLPHDNLWATYGLICLHLLIFTAMVFAGIDALSPRGDDLLEWGANHKSSALNGESWRLLTSVFIHSNVWSLLLNLLALLYIGAILEPLLGATAFLVVYVLAGVCGSVMSLWWHDLAISAGSAGAIFGLYGVFVVLLLLKSVLLKASPIAFLISTGLFVIFNLTSSLNQGIDNAAHVGGLMGGFIMGLFLYFSLHAREYPSIRRANLLLMISLFVFILYGGYTLVPDAIARYDKVMKEFATNDSIATEAYRNTSQLTQYEWRRQLREKGMKRWEANIQLLNSLHGLPEPLATRIYQLRKYCELRKAVFRMRINSINQKTNQYEEQIVNTNKEIEGLLLELKGEIREI